MKISANSDVIKNEIIFYLEQQKPMITHDIKTGPSSLPVVVPQPDEKLVNNPPQKKTNKGALCVVRQMQSALVHKRMNKRMP